MIDVVSNSQRPKMSKMSVDGNTRSSTSSTSSRAAELRSESKIAKAVIAPRPTASSGDVSETFSKRMKRDQRFMKSGGVSKSPASLKRSPLQVVQQNDENSPIAASRSTKAANGGKKRKSEEGVAQPNASKRPYLSRLRSQFASAN